MSLHLSEQKGFQGFSFQVVLFLQIGQDMIIAISSSINKLDLVFPYVGHDYTAVMCCRVSIIIDNLDLMPFIAFP